MSAPVRSRGGVYEAELAREVQDFCHRVLGEGALAQDAAATALAGEPERVTALGRAARACRERAAAARTLPPPVPPDDGGLVEAVAFELATATRALPDRQREVIALRETLRLSYTQIGLAMGVDVTAVAALLARARLGLRTELRGSAASAAVGSSCAERERSLRVLARRQDSEALEADEDDWILDHLGRCAECARAHAAMLEASVRYRAWRRR